VLARPASTRGGRGLIWRPSLRDLLPDPWRCATWNRPPRGLLTAVQRRERIAIFADYDVDGGASAALLI
jgi:single-stranded-DNA-specific exonuclease